MMRPGPEQHQRYHSISGSSHALALHVIPCRLPRITLSCLLCEIYRLHGSWHSCALYSCSRPSVMDERAPRGGPPAGRSAGDDIARREGVAPFGVESSRGVAADERPRADGVPRLVGVRCAAYEARSAESMPSMPPGESEEASDCASLRPAALSGCGDGRGDARGEAPAAAEAPVVLIRGLEPLGVTAPPRFCEPCAVPPTTGDLQLELFALRARRRLAASAARECSRSSLSGNLGILKGCVPSRPPSPASGRRSGVPSTSPHVIIGDSSGASDGDGVETG